MALDLDAQIREIIRFDRFYARRLRSAIREAFATEANAAELGIFHELLARPCTPAWLSWRLGIDAGYLSRRLKLLELTGHIATSVHHADRRRRQIELTEWGRQVARGLEAFHEDQVRRAIEWLPAHDRGRLVRAMGVITEILGRDSLTSW